MMLNIKEIFKKLRGKKRNIGVTAMWLLKLITLAFPDFIPPGLHDGLNQAIDVLLLGGTVDSVARSNTAKTKINNIMSKIKK